MDKTEAYYLNRNIQRATLIAFLASSAIFAAFWYLADPQKNFLVPAAIVLFGFALYLFIVRPGIEKTIASLAKEQKKRSN